MTRKACLVAFLALSVGYPATAQDDADKVRLDDFALPQAKPDTSVEQLDHRDAKPDFTRDEPNDRAISIPGPPASEKGPVKQLSRPGEDRPVPQVASGDSSKDVSSASVSSTADSPPGSVVVLAGKDKCDPQQASKESAECRKILEKRAAEFHAVEAPKLSAEQVLLAEQGVKDQTTSTPSTMLEYAARKDPDAAIKSNQEIASLLFAPGTVLVPSSSAATDTSGRANTVGQIVGDLSVNSGVQPQP